MAANAPARTLLIDEMMNGPSAVTMIPSCVHMPDQVAAIPAALPPKIPAMALTNPSAPNSAFLVESYRATDFGYYFPI